MTIGEQACAILGGMAFVVGLIFFLITLIDWLRDRKTR